MIRRIKVWDKVSRGLLLLLAAAILLTIAPAAFAIEQEEYGAKFMVSDDPSVVDVDIINFKARLNELGFYSVEVSDDVLQSQVLDNLTMAAVKQVCRLNPEFKYYENGVTNELYWRVMGQTEGPLVTPIETEYQDIEPGTENEAVTNIQTRLNQLGYGEAAGTFTAGVYDDVLQKAIENFVKSNKMVYEENGITAELQQAIFSEDALPYTPPKGLSNKIFSYVKGSTTIAGINLPNAVVLLIAFMLICIIVILIIKLTAKSTPDGRVENRSLYLILILLPVTASLLLLALASFLYFLLGVVVVLISLVILKRQKPELFVRKKQDSTQTPGIVVPPVAGPAPRTYLILAEQGPLDGCRIRVDKPTFYIGRDDHSDFQLNDSHIGRRHLCIEYHEDEDACYGVDLGSVNGTYLNSTRMISGQPYRLSQGDRITLYDRPFEVEYAYY